MKECTKCGVIQDYDKFSNRKTASDGKKSQCKICDSIEYDEAKAAGKIKKGKKSNHEAIFRAKHGVSAGTVRAYVNRNYSFLWGECTPEEQLSIIEEYKEFRNRPRVSKGYKRRIK